ncbi:hypothetical protein BU14_0523s0006 [Porphyra umbilicalis]|uniref:Uncharacterized protein n=1 Tax=Porphyra umbilicalis TaxID=2786 RepID=A0A1X6NSD1_PORUM|nr:hypothetical protein BU14_0523s0006 [Porphyra umbilicalis]|eukprot:OSX71539.1 hypothetical protein BU14_0523s0006 [Porphyra umbilicalis]
MGFYGTPNMPMMPGMHGYSSPFPRPPAPFSGMPMAMPPMQPTGDFSQQLAVGSSAAMPSSLNPIYGGNTAAAAAVAGVPTGTATAATAAPTGSATATAGEQTGTTTAAAGVPIGTATAAAATPTGSATAAAATPTGSATAAAGVPTGTATVATAAPTGSATAAVAAPMGSAPVLAAGYGQVSMAPLLVPGTATGTAVARVSDDSTAPSASVAAFGTLAPAASSEAVRGGTGTGAGSSVGPSSITPPTTSPLRGVASRRTQLLTSPTTPSTLARPSTPPALVRAGRRTGPPRARITSAPATASLTPTVAAPMAPTSRVANPSAPSRRAPRGRASDSASGGGSATTPAVARRAPRGGASAASSGTLGGDTAGSVATATLPGATAAAPLAGGHLPAINADAAVEGVAGAEIMRVLSGMNKMVGTLADAVQSIGNKVQTQGLAMQNLGVQVSRIKDAPPMTVPAPLRRLFRGFVDTDGEYSEDSELKEICGVTFTGGAPLLADAHTRLAAMGKVVSPKQKGTLKMLSIRRRVKSRFFGHVGGATITNDVIPDTDADWEMLMEETMSDLDIDAPEAYDFLTSDISSPAKRKRAARSKGKGKAVGKGKGKARRKSKSMCARDGPNSGSDSCSGSGSSSCPDDEVGATKKVGVATASDEAEQSGGSKGHPIIRAYQPMTQSISHVLEAIKKRIVPVWFVTVGSSVKTMGQEAATTWFENMNKLPDDEDEITEEQRNAPVRPRFICSDDGHDGILAAVKEMFVHLGVGDRIRMPVGLGNKETAYTTTGHIALAATFVRAELEQIAAGVRRKRRGKDNGWYDRWRWEVITVHPLMPTTTEPWRGFVISDANSPTRCDFDHPPVPVNSIRTRTVRARPAPTNTTERTKEVVTAGSAQGHAPAVSPSTTGAAAAVGATEVAEATGTGASDDMAGDATV